MINSFVDELKKERIPVSIELFGLSMNETIRFKCEDSERVFAAVERVKPYFSFLFLMGEERENKGIWSFVFGENGTQKKVILATSGERDDESGLISAISISPFFPEARVYEEALEVEGWIQFLNPLEAAASDGEFFVHEIKARKKSFFLSLEDLP